MDERGYSRKRHITVKFPKTWRRKTRKPAGSISTRVSRSRESDMEDIHSAGSTGSPSNPATQQRLEHEEQPRQHRQQQGKKVTNAHHASCDMNRVIDGHSENNTGHDSDNLTDESSDIDIQGLYGMDEYCDDVSDVAPPDAETEGGSDSEERGSRHQKAKIEKILLRKHVLSGLVQVIGSSRLTAKQYRMARSFANYEGEYGKKEGYPSYSSICATILPAMRKYVYVPTVQQYFEVDPSRSGAPQPLGSATGELVPTKKPVKLILPSSWAKKDISTIPAFSSVVGVLLDQNRSCPKICHTTVDGTPILRIPSETFRSHVLQAVSRNQNVWISDSNVQDATSIELTLHCPPRNARDLLTSLGGQYRIEDRNQTMLIKGKVVTTRLQENAENGLAPGDVVTLLNIPNCPATLSTLLIHRMKRTSRHPPQSIIIRRTGGTSREVLIRCKRISAVSTFATNPSHPVPLPHVRTYGRLADGRLYSVYRFILYSDDFEQFVRKKGSAGGCYLLPVRLPLEQRAGRGAVRVISLTPPGISTNKAILSVIPDIVNATKTGFETMDYFGVRRTAFIEVIAYIGDYVAVQHVQDLNGPWGVAPCSLCTFPKGSATGATSSEYAYSVTAHSGHASFRRDKKRMRTLRRNCSNSAELQFIGLRQLTSEQEKELPLHALSDALENARKDIPITEHGDPVVSAFFDPYLSALVAPDHLFSGLGEDVINANMRLLSKQRRLTAEALMQYALSESGLGTEPHLYNHDKLQLHKMSICTMYSLILVAPWAIYLSSAFNSDGTRNGSTNGNVTPCMDLLFRYQKLVSETLFFPICDIDGKDAVLKYNESGGKSRLMQLKTRCNRYIQAVDSVCAKNHLAKKEVDKPNVHRLLELYNHTIPLLGHIRHGQELLFEAAHQPLKRGLKQSNNRDSQLTAMDEMLANDWKSRIASTLRTFDITENDELSDSVCMRLKDIITGDTGTHSDDGYDGAPERIRQCFKQPVIDHILSVAHGLKTVQVRAWIPVDVKKKRNDEFSLLTDTTAAIKYISSLNKQFIDTGGTIRRVMYAKSVHIQKHSSPMFCSTAPQNSIHLLRRSDVIQAAIRVTPGTEPNNAGPVAMVYLQEDLKDCAAALSCSRRFFLLLDIIYLSTPIQDEHRSAADTLMFAIVWPISHNATVRSPISQYYDTYSVTEKNTLFILPLKSTIRKVMSLHVCNWNSSTACRAVLHTRTCNHSGTLADGEPYLLFGSAEGYPPRFG